VSYNVVEMYEKEHMKRDIPDTPIGSTVKVHYRIIEGEKERIQIFEGIVIARKNAGLRSSITVRKVTAGVGVERVFPLHSPKIDKIQVTRLGKVRRSKLYYLRALKGKKARIREKDQY
jgi:large subunit ribosomal protein L19